MVHPIMKIAIANHDNTIVYRRIAIIGCRSKRCAYLIPIEAIAGNSCPDNDVNNNDYKHILPNNIT